MPQVEISIPEDVFVQFERLSEEEFLSEEEAVQELLRLGLDAYSTEDTGSGREEDVMEEMSEIFDETEGRADEDQF